MQTSLMSDNAPSPRDYQQAIAQSVLARGSTLVVLPTGLGKTLIAIMVASKKLESGRALILAPTRPLVAQHEKVFRDWISLPQEEIVLVSGLIPAKKRQEIYAQNPKLILSTPQTIANDLKHGRLKFDFSLVVFDEVHRAVGKYAYTCVAKAATDGGATVLGLTASPGGKKKRIEEILATLGISNVEIRTSDDSDVAKYVKPLEIEWIEVELPQSLLEHTKIISEMIQERNTALNRMGFVGGYKTKKSLAEWRARILQSRSPLRFSALSHHATLFSLVHLLELLETQGVESVIRFVERVRGREPSKAQARLINDGRIATMIEKLKAGAEHPKLARMLDVIRSRPAGEKFIIFSQYRDQVQVLERELNYAGFKSRAFMGKKDGVSAKSQAAVINDFRAGLFDILVATSIGEEGLDIPSVDNVIFYEPVPSEIRAIQRRGRAGRAKLGRMFGLIAKGTRDSASFWSAKKKEEKMRKIVYGLSSKKDGIPPSARAKDWGSSIGAQQKGIGGAGESPDAGQQKSNGGPQEIGDGASARVGRDEGKKNKGGEAKKAAAAPKSSKDGGDKSAGQQKLLDF